MELNGHIHMALIHSSSRIWRSRARAEAVEHSAIVDALEMRDLPRLQAAITAHLTRASASLMADLATQNAAGEGDSSLRSA
jgi:DNA-binding GntR family transcriptional regulator